MKITNFIAIALTGIFIGIGKIDTYLGIVLMVYFADIRYTK